MTGTDWLDQLEQKAAAAIPGPWEQRKTVWVMTKDDTFIASGMADRDAEFIAAANPTVVQRLINEVRNLRQERADYWADLDSEHYRVTAERDELAAKITAVEAAIDRHARVCDDYDDGLADIRAAIREGAD